MCVSLQMKIQIYFMANGMVDIAADRFQQALYCCKRQIQTLFICKRVNLKAVIKITKLNLPQLFLVTSTKVIEIA